jgi:hypothetical protein
VDSVAPTDLAGLKVAARRFPGFSAVVQRRFADIPVPQDVKLRNDPKLMLKCFCNPRLDAAELEIGFFRDWKRKGAIDLEGPWPTGADADGQFADTFSRHLWRADAPFDGPPRNPPAIDQIHHFICHCSFDETNSFQSSLELSDDDRITIGELMCKIGTYGPASRLTPKPLVFLNACKSAKSRAGFVSFPEFFLKHNHNRGYIGTGIEIPDRTAAQFSQTFYTQLLQRPPKTVGMALYDAKMRLLELNNPLGITYVLYADPDTQVETEVPSVVAPARRQFWNKKPRGAARAVQAQFGS